MREEQDRVIGIRLIHKTPSEFRPAQNLDVWLRHKFEQDRMDQNMMFHFGNSSDRKKHYEYIRTLDPKQMKGGEKDANI